ncbi:HAD-like domain containing protein [Russula decolorans]
MTKENLLVRVLGSCETMANASVICTDKTGTLTQNEMTIIAGSIGIHAKFVWQLDENPARAGNEDTNRPNAKDSVIDISNPKSTLTPQLVELLNASVAINSTTFKDVDSENGATVEYDNLATDLTLIGITGIEDPLREGVREAVAKCKNAGVRVTMCTGENVLTARSIAHRCNIYTPGGIIMEGPHFCMFSPEIMIAIAPRLQDRRMLVEVLKERGDIIGVTGDGTNDGPALKTAHIGFSMGITGTEVAKEASDIILLDDNFSSISALSAAQLLWINLIIDGFATLALTTDQATEALLNRKPDKKTDSLFTVDMIKQIIRQSTYLISVILIFHFLGSKILGYRHVDDSKQQKHQDTIVQTLVFNAFVFARIWNSKLNVFVGMTKNWHFIAITSIKAVAQIIICTIGGVAFQVTCMGAKEWIISLALGFIALPLGALIRLISNEPCKRVFVKLRLLPKPEEEPTFPSDVESSFASAVDRIADNIDCKCNSLPIFRSGLLGMVPTLVVASSRQPLNGSLLDPAGFNPSRSSTALWENKFEVHPDTPRDDPVFRILGAASRPLTPR